MLRWSSGLLAVLGALAVAGCDSAGDPAISDAWWNSFLDPTKTGNFREDKVQEIRKTISFRDQAPGIPGAVDPTPDDLVAHVEEYKIAPSDTIQITILDFLIPDAESGFQPTVDELGYIHIPQLGWIQVEGMTTRDLQAELIQRSRDAGIFPPDQNPTVVVSLLTQQKRIYNLSGAIAAPGVYRIPRADFRLRDSLNQAGGLDDLVKTLYVFRNEDRRSEVRDPMRKPSDTLSEDLAPAMPPVSPILPAEMAQNASPPANGGGNPQPSARDDDSGALALPPEEVERILIDAVAPTPELDDEADDMESVEAAPVDPVETATAPAIDQAEPNETAQPSFIYVNDKFKEAPMQQETDDAEATESLEEAEAFDQLLPELSEEVVDWEELAVDGQQRIIRIPADKLRQGDSNYNIVVREGDWIRLDPGPVGVFYLMGEVNGPGVFNLNGQEVTLRQAIAAAGGLNPIAWPTRCNIVRRIDQDREEMTQWNLARILDFRDPDMFLKPNDVVHVGTHAIAPLLATIRNSFRFTYGFGFVYDRNFADVDAVSAKQNPSDVARFSQNSLFPGLF